jgi:hypothetical protein
MVDGDLERKAQREHRKGHGILRVAKALRSRHRHSAADQARNGSRLNGERACRRRSVHPDGLASQGPQSQKILHPADQFAGPMRPRALSLIVMTPWRRYCTAMLTLVRRSSGAARRIVHGYMPDALDRPLTKLGISHPLGPLRHQTPVEEREVFGHISVERKHCKGRRQEEQRP